MPSSSASAGANMSLANEYAQLGNLGCHLFDVAKTHADVEPVQDTSWRRLNRRLHNALQSVGAIGENHHLGFRRPAIGLERRFHEFHRVRRPTGDPSESACQYAVAFNSTRNYVVLIKTGVEVRPNVGTVDGDDQPRAAGHWVAAR